MFKHFVTDHTLWIAAYPAVRPKSNQFAFNNPIIAYYLYKVIN